MLHAFIRECSQRWRTGQSTDPSGVPLSTFLEQGVKLGQKAQERESTERGKGKEADAYVPFVTPLLPFPSFRFSEPLQHDWEDEWGEVEKQGGLDMIMERENKTVFVYL